MPICVAPSSVLPSLALSLPCARGGGWGHGLPVLPSYPKTARHTGLPEKAQPAACQPAVRTTVSREKPFAQDPVAGTMKKSLSLCVLIKSAKI